MYTKNVSLNYYSELIEPAITWAREVIKTKFYANSHTYNQYAEYEKCLDNFYRGKLCELILVKILRHYGHKVNKDMLEVKNRGQVNFDTDLPGIEVKSCPSYSAEKYGLSWNFTSFKQTRHKIALFQTYPGLIKFYGCYDSNIIRPLLKDPVGNKYLGLKKCLFYSDLPLLPNVSI